MKHFTVIAPPYGKKTLVAVGLSKEKLLSQIKKARLRKSLYKRVSGDKVPDKTCRAFAYIDEDYGNSIIYLNKWQKLGLTKKQIEAIGEIVHELNHVGVNIMKNIGSNIMKDDEPFCYSTEDLFVKILKKLR